MRPISTLDPCCRHALGRPARPPDLLGLSATPLEPDPLATLAIAFALDHEPTHRFARRWSVVERPGATSPHERCAGSEESPQQWQLRGRRLDLGDQVGWLCRPFFGRPRPEQWQALLERVSEEAVAREVSLLVIDPLAAFFPDKSENSAAAMLDALAPLQRLASRGLSVLALHHPAKKEQSYGSAGRGSGALLGYADILMEMRWYRRPSDDDRRRRLFALSRFEETPRELVIELNTEGTDYLARGCFADEEFASRWRLMETLLRQADRKLSREDILAGWPAEERPDAKTVYRWLRRAVEAGMLRQDGLGHRNGPFRYWLPESEERWREDPLAMLRMPELFRPASFDRQPGKSARRV